MKQYAFGFFYLLSFFIIFLSLATENELSWHYLRKAPNLSHIFIQGHLLPRILSFFRDAYKSVHVYTRVLAFGYVSCKFRYFSNSHGLYPLLWNFFSVFNLLINCCCSTIYDFKNIKSIIVWNYFYYRLLSSRKCLTMTTMTVDAINSEVKGMIEGMAYRYSYSER